MDRIPINSDRPSIITCCHCWVTNTTQLQHGSELTRLTWNAINGTVRECRDLFFLVPTARSPKSHRSPHQLEPATSTDALGELGSSLREFPMQKLLELRCVLNFVQATPILRLVNNFAHQ